MHENQRGFTWISPDQWLASIIREIKEAGIDALVMGGQRGESPGLTFDSEPKA